MLAHAFADNPLNLGVIGGDHTTRVRCNEHGMRALLPVAIRHGQALAAVAGARLTGCLVATPPLAHPLPPPSIAARLRCRFGQGGRVTRRWAAVFLALDRHHPRTPHWYLGSVGVLPETQGSGVGSALLRRLLASVDAEQAPAYLETDRRENIGFYERRGFRVQREIQVLGVPAWCMWRPTTATKSA